MCGNSSVDLGRTESDRSATRGGGQCRTAESRAHRSSARFHPWQRERAIRLHLICRWIVYRVQHGRQLGRAIRAFSRRWHGRRYTSEPGRRIHLSSGTLTREFYRWHKSSQSPAAFALHYTSWIQPVHVAAFLRDCLTPGTTSFRAVYQRLKNPAGGEAAFRYAIKRDARDRVKKLFKTRLQAAREESKLRRLIERQFPK